MTTRPPLRIVLGWLVVLLLSGCFLSPSAQSPTPSASPTGPDFAQPGQASVMVQRLLTEAGHRRALMVEVTKTSVQVSMLGSDQTPVTWAYRDGEIGQVTSDLAYVDQATFDVDRFNISDVGALFRAAASMSGSQENQSLTIVDYSGGEVMMSVSTVPESRTVFFNPDGSLLEILDFDTPGGVARGIEAAVGPRLSVYSVTVESEQGAWVDYPGADDTVVRRTRTAKVPVTTNVRAENVDLPLFSTGRIDAEAIWEIVDAVRGSSEVPEDTTWSVVIDDRTRLGIPRMHFAIGSKVLVTDLSGNVVSR